MNYKKLRILRLHFPPRSYFEDCPEELLDKVLPSLENLKIFTICNSEIDSFGIHSLISTTLTHCPKLTSVGHFDSVMATDFIKAKSDKSHTGCLRLKKCFWRLWNAVNLYIDEMKCLTCNPVFLS
ncbi:hypothetical protein CEXT_311121 [Caerostris extrusa]|uniref:Uncharacterized protein n=1 Tax=Caerostris extrusa TaxID=172846 RepID=A0AAV4PN02_CAEEX|nr:hypothetical protein CEXT_311121 [Caerostris extrusa]